MSSHERLLSQMPHPLYPPHCTPLALLQPLHALIGGQTNDALTYFLSEKLLVRVTLPSPALALLLDLLCLPAGPGPHPGSGAGRSLHSGTPNLTQAASGADPGRNPCPDATPAPAVAAGLACTLAHVWSDPASISSTPVYLQAYQTHALSLLLLRLDKAAVEGSPGLLGCLLQGVSGRLGSPRVALRLQAMRLARVFSTVLDPSASLFEDQGDLGWHPEELWPGAERGAEAGVRAGAEGGLDSADVAVAGSLVDVAVAGSRVASSEGASSTALAPVSSGAAVGARAGLSHDPDDVLTSWHPAVAVADLGGTAVADSTGLPDSDDESSSSSSSEDDEGLRPLGIAEDPLADEWDTADSKVGRGPHLNMFQIFFYSLQSRRRPS